MVRTRGERKKKKKRRKKRKKKKKKKGPTCILSVGVADPPYVHVLYCVVDIAGGTKKKKKKKPAIQTHGIRHCSQFGEHGTRDRIRIPTSLNLGA